MTPHAVFPISEASQVGEARRHAAGLSAAAGFDDVTAGRLALVVTELGTNLARHARGGRLLMAVLRGSGGATAEVLSLDDGPGMGNVANCLADGYSSSGTPGTGLGAVRRLSSEFEIFSLVGQGSVIVARIAPSDRARAPAPVFEVGGVCIAAPYETVSGDGWAVHQQDGRAAVMVADGLGHGVEAAAAADAALAVFARQPFSPPDEVLQAAHVTLRSLRGAAVAIATLDSAARTVGFCGAGNIAGRIVSGVDDRSLMSQHGTVGLQMRQLQEVQYPWPDHAQLILHSDGIISRWSFDQSPGLLQCGATLIAAWLLRSYVRGRDDATVVVVRLR